MQYLCHSYLPADTAEETVRKIDFNKITHLNFAFSTVEKDDNGEYLPTVSEKVALGIKRTKEIIAEQHAQTKTILSIGGAGAGNFCESCSSESARKAFAARCAELINEFGIDGIDLDWEFPGRAHLGVSRCDRCTTDYIELCREIKRAIGSSLLTAAVGSDLWGDLDYSQLNDVFDFVNVMTYDMTGSDHSSFALTVKNMNDWAKLIDKSKLILGVPFYARSETEKYNWIGYCTLMELVGQGKARLERGEDQDYIIIEDAKLGIDTPESIIKKARWVKENGFGGIFNWQEGSDFNGALRAAMWSGMFGE